MNPDSSSSSAVPGVIWPFRKMHGLGNDFLLFDARAEPLVLAPQQVRALADRMTGIGFDQLIIMEPSARADVFMRIYNADGGEVSACGNASRCVAALLGGTASIETAAGLLATSAEAAGDERAGHAQWAQVDMGVPDFDWRAVPLAYAMDTLHMPVAWGDLADPVAVSVGNPHVVFFGPDIGAQALSKVGPLIEHDPLFPERVNVNMAQVAGRDRIELLVWERGAGLTRACGTGACATAVAAMRRGLTDRAVRVCLPGGDLHIVWDGNDHIQMSGPVATSFTGAVDLGQYL